MIIYYPVSAGQEFRNGSAVHSDLGRFHEAAADGRWGWSRLEGSFTCESRLGKLKLRGAAQLELLRPLSLSPPPYVVSPAW